MKTTVVYHRQCLRLLNAKNFVCLLLGMTSEFADGSENFRVISSGSQLKSDWINRYIIAVIRQQFVLGTITRFF